MDSDPRQAANLAGSQVGEVKIDTAAAGNVYHNADAKELRAFVLDYIWHVDQQTDIYRDEQRRRIQQIQFELWLYRLALLALILFVVMRL